MTEFWLTSVPEEKTSHKAWHKMISDNLCTNHKFSIPKLKVGKPACLIRLSDELPKLDSFVERVVRKVAQYMAEVLEDGRDRAQENLLVSGVDGVRVDLMTYIKTFQWDTAKYPIQQPLQNIYEVISKQVTLIDDELKSRATVYNNLKGKLQSLQKYTGSLLTGSLTDIVKREHFILNSEYLITLLVVVPKTGYGDWESTYETLAGMVVPRSSVLVCEDGDCGLFTVSLFRRATGDFKLRAREKKFTVRDFEFDEEEMRAEREELKRVSDDTIRQHAQLIQWLQVNFSEVFMAWIHIKAMEVFVDSLLRYGLSLNFQPMLLQPKTKSTKKLRELLFDLYKDLDATAAPLPDAVKDIPGLILIQQDYYPYVNFQIDCNLLSLTF